MSRSSTRLLTHKTLNDFARHPEKINYTALTDKAGPAAARLVRTVIANLTYLDLEISALTDRRANQMELDVHTALRMGAAELLLLEGKEHAAIFENVELLPKQQPHRRGFVNGILRSLQRQLAKGALAPLPDRHAEPAAFFEKRYSQPAWLVKMLSMTFGEERTARLCLSSNQPAPTVLRNNQHHQSRTVLMEQLKSLCETIIVSPHSENALTVTGLAALDDPGLSPLWNSGAFYFQNTAAQLASHLLTPKPGNRVVDLCSAPGGKATHLAELMGNQGKVTAVDANPEKMPRLRENVKRLHLDCVEPQIADIEKGEANRWVTEADAVLLDPPCSALGIQRKAPEVRWLHTPESIAKLAQRQWEMLAMTFSQMRRGARGVYSVCTFTPAETFQVIHRACRELPGFRLIPITAATHPHLTALLSNGCFLSLTGEGGLDGYFIALFEKQ